MSLFLSLAVIPNAWGGAVSGLSASPQRTLQTTADLVKVDVSTADKNGNFVGGLEQKDFRVLDNRAEQPTVFFSPVEAPAQILVMIETGPAVYLIRNEHLTAAYALLDGLAPGDQVALASYDREPRQRLAFTSDKSALLSALGGIQYDIGMGDLNFYDCLSTVLDWLKPLDGKRALVLLTTGLDSSQPAHWTALVGKLRRGDVVIFPVALGGSLRGSASAKPKKWKNVPGGESAGSDPAVPRNNPVSFARADQDLRSLATITGGRAYFPDSRQDFQSIYREIASALRHQYVLGFVPSHDGQYHSLSVEVTARDGASAKPGNNNPGYHVLARAGYLAPGP